MTTRVGSPPVCESITFMRRTGILSHKKAQKSQNEGMCPSSVLNFLRLKVRVVAIYRQNEQEQRLHCFPFER